MWKGEYLIYIYTLFQKHAIEKALKIIQEISVKSPDATQKYLSM